MGERGRKSNAELSVAASNALPISATQRAQPPADLTEDQADVWAEIVNRLPADWFPCETWPVLAAYCRHTVAARRVAALIRACESQKELDLDEYEKLLRMQERESRALTALGRSMRITQQTTYSARKTKPAKGGSTKVPWES